MNIKNWLYDYYKEPAKMLLHTGVVSWTLSSLAQVAAIMVNDKIPKEQKEFLIPQEIADGAINILSFAIVTSQFTKISKKLVESGKLSTKNIKNFIETIGESGKLNKYSTNIEEILNENAQKIELGNFKTEIESIEKLNTKMRHEYAGLKTGVTVIGSTIGAVVASNFITPYLRNKIGAHRQKQALAKNAAVTKPEVQKSRITMDDYRSKTAKPAFTSLSGSLKI